MLDEQLGGLRLLAENPGHVGAGVQEHAHIQDDVAVVGKELDGLWATVFGEDELVFREVADEAFLVVAHGKVDRDEVNPAANDVFLAGFVLCVLPLGENPLGELQTNQC